MKLSFWFLMAESQEHHFRNEEETNKEKLIDPTVQTAKWCQNFHKKNIKDGKTEKGKLSPHNLAM